ncbi:MAG: FkbM family methyltransferase [Gemmataceae bacterium]
MDAIRFILTPGLFPQELDYHLVTDREFVPETLHFLRAFAPRTRFLGSASPWAGRGAGEGALVVSSRSWEPVVTRLLQQGIEPQRIVVLLNPDDYCWGWLALGRACLSHLRELADPSVPLPRKTKWLRDYLRQVGLVSFEGSRPSWFPNCYFNVFRDKVRANLATVDDMTRRLADRESRDTLRLLLYGSPEDYLRHFLDHAFFTQQYTDLIQLEPGDNIVNAGIASGWDIPLFQALTRNRGRHVLVEPAETPERFRQPPFETAPYALWDREETVAFRFLEAGMVGYGTGDAAGGGDGPRVRCRPLDHIVDELALERVALIKADIEGAEPRALEGMKATLRTRRPQIALAIYHEPEHMWELPLTLMNLLPDYSFFIRHYGLCRFECLLYAIPNERMPASRTQAGRPGIRPAWPTNPPHRAAAPGIPVNRASLPGSSVAAC